MASIRSKLTVLAVAGLLVLAAAAQAGLLPRGVDVIEGTITAFDAQSGRLTLDGRTLQLNAQTVVQKRVGGHYEAADWTQIWPGSQAKAVAHLSDGHLVVRSLDLIEKAPSQAK